MKWLIAALRWLASILFDEWRKPHSGKPAGGGEEVRDDVNGSVDNMIDTEDDARNGRR